MKRCPKCSGLSLDNSWLCSCGYEFSDTEEFAGDDPVPDVAADWPTTKTKLFLISGAFAVLGIYVLIISRSLNFLAGFWLLPVGLSKAIFGDKVIGVTILSSYTFYSILICSLIFTRKNLFGGLYILLVITLIVSMHGCQQILRGLSSIT